ncbi:MAG: TVP38/TMEM64 family protein [Pseudohongiellaceae bacterium]
MFARLSLFHLLLMSIALFFLIVAVLVYYDVHLQVVSLLQWMNSRSPAMQWLFVLVMALSVVLILPGVIFTLGAGFVFGVFKGALFVVIGTTIGAVTAFVIARYLFSHRVGIYLLSHPRLKVIDDRTSSEGWKLILATRLVPLFPFKLSNYFFGLTRFSLRDFALGTGLGIIPYSFHNVYVGSIAASLTELGQVEARTPVQWTFYGLGFVLTVAALLYFRRLAHRVLAEAGMEGQFAGNQTPVESGQPQDKSKDGKES